MTFQEYQLRARETAVYCVPGTGIYPVMGLAGEVGEVAEKIKKLHRDHGGKFPDHTYAMDVALELGDVLWYLSALAGDIGFTLDEVAQLNIEKVESRRSRGVTHGSGDNR